MAKNLDMSRDGRDQPRIPKIRDWASIGYKYPHLPGSIESSESKGRERMVVV